MAFPESSRRRWPIAAGAVALVLITAAATALVTRDRTEPVVRAATEQTSAASGSSSTRSTVPPSPTAVPKAEQKVYKFGEKVPFPDASATAYAYRQPTGKGAEPPSQSGYEWGSADVEVCVTKDSTVSRESWHLVYADHSVIEPSHIGWGQFQKPEYPWDDRDVAAGRCIRGWITFGAPANSRPVMVEYTPTGAIIDWTVS